MTNVRTRRLTLATSVVVGVLVVAACGSSTLPQSALPPVSPVPTSGSAADTVTTEIPTVFDVPGDEDIASGGDTGADTGSDADSGSLDGSAGASDGSDGSTGSDDDEQSGSGATDDAPIGLTAVGDWQDATANLFGLPSTCGNLSYISADAANGAVIAGVASNGLWRLNDTDGWDALGVAPGSAEINNRTSWIEYDPLVPERYWETGAYGQGVYRTDDGGVSFKQLGEIMNIDFISVDETDALRKTMLAGVHEKRIVYRSVDGGVTWFDIAGDLPPGVGYTAFPLVIDATTHVLGTYRGEDAGIFRSEDGGLTWTTIHEGAVSGPPLVVGDTIYWLRPQGSGIVVSKDGGATFTPAGGRIGGRPAMLVALPDGGLLAASEGTLAVSRDEGASWRPFGPALPYEPNGLAFSEARSAIYLWKFSCDFSGEGNPVPKGAIIRLDVTLDG
jgi:photosystem II stability/assembly factor-like uncharacterized protein